MMTVLLVRIPLVIVLKVIVLMRIALTVRVLKATVLMLTVIMRIVLLSKIMMIVLLGQIINEHQASPVRVRSVGTPRATCAVLRLTNHLHIIIILITIVVIHHNHTLLHIIPLFIICSRINCEIKFFFVAKSNGD